MMKGELTSIDILIGVPGKKKKKSKKGRKGDRDEGQELTAEQQKLRNIKMTVDDAIEAVIARLDAMAEQLEGASSMDETILIAKRIRSAKRVLSTVPMDGASET